MTAFLSRIGRTAALVLLACLLLAFSCLTGCSRAAVVMEYNGARLPEDVYAYWLACYRAQFASRENGENTAALAAEANANIACTLIAVSLFDGLGLSLSQAARTQIDLAMQSLVAANGGTREGLDKVAARYRTNYDALKIAVTYEQKANALYHYYFDDGGAFSVTEDVYESYMKEHYARVDMIFIPLVDFVTDDSGNRVYDAAAGRYKTVPKSGEVLAARQAEIEKVRAALADGTDAAAFAALAKEYGADTSRADYTMGYYFSDSTDYRDYVPAIPRAALGLAEGETTEVESYMGVHFLLRLPFEGGDYAKKVNEDFFDGFTDRVKQQLFHAMISAYLNDVIYDSAALGNYNYATTEPNYDLYW